MKKTICDICEKNEGKSIEYVAGTHLDPADSRTRDTIERRDICGSCARKILRLFLADSERHGTLFTVYIGKVRSENIGGK